MAESGKQRESIIYTRNLRLHLVGSAQHYTIPRAAKPRDADAHLSSSPMSSSLAVKDNDNTAFALIDQWSSDKFEGECFDYVYLTRLHWHGSTHSFASTLQSWKEIEIRKSPCCDWSP